MNNSRAKGHIAILFANIIFGLNTPISRALIHDGLSPFALTFFRMAGAMILFWSISFFMPKEKVPWKDKGKLLCAGLIGILLNQTLFLSGLSHTSPIDASIVITLLPVFTMCLAALILKEPITLKKAAGVAIGALGAILLITRAVGVEAGNGHIVGNIMILGSGLSYALYLSLFKNLISKYSPIIVMKWMFSVAAISSLPLCIPALVSTDYLALSGAAYLKIGYVVGCATFLSYMLIPIGQRFLRPTTLSMYNYLQPIVASLVAVAMNLDHFGWEKLAAGILVFIGVFLVTRSKSRAQVLAERDRNSAEP